MTKRLISADSHFCEPPDLWTTRLPQRYRDRAPRTVRGLDGRPGEFFVCEDIQPRNVFAASAAGVPPNELPTRAEQGFAAAPPSVWDPLMRLADQDLDGVAAEMMFPTFADLLFGVRDAGFRRECFRAYNDFAAEYCLADPRRLLGAALVDEEDVAAAVAELERAVGAGLRAVVLRADSQRNYGDAAFDPFWATAIGLGVPVVVHRGAVRKDVVVHTKEALQEYVMIPAQAQRALTSITFGGVWERFPEMQLVLCEFDLLWLPHFLDRLGRAHDKYGAFGLNLSRPAAEQVTSGTWLTFQHETEEVAQIMDVWPEDRLMWASDYPHADASWPHSRELVGKLSAAVGETTADRMTRDTAAAVFGIPLPADAAVTAGGAG